jgi:hypothetical protein
VQALINWLTMRTAAGELFDIDTALRPNGGSGLLVTSIDSFANYQTGRGSNTAWTWEHQALTRARWCAGLERLAPRFEAVRRSVLAAPRDRAALAAEVTAMREKVRAAHPVKPGRFGLKHSAGGMIDVEFAVQALVLAESGIHPELLDNVGNIALLGRAEAAGLLPAGVGSAAADAYRDLRRAQAAVVLATVATVGCSPANGASPGADPTQAPPADRPIASWTLTGGRARSRRPAGLGLDSSASDWQPALALREPWRAWSGRLFTSTLHLVANLAGTALVGALGFIAHAQAQRRRLADRLAADAPRLAGPPRPRPLRRPLRRASRRGRGGGGAPDRGRARLAPGDRPRHSPHSRSRWRARRRGRPRRCAIPKTDIAIAPFAHATDWSPARRLGTAEGLARRRALTIGRQ